MKREHLNIWVRAFRISEATWHVCLSETTQLGRKKGNFGTMAGWNTTTVKADWTNLEFDAYCHGNSTTAHPPQANQNQSASPSLVYQSNLEKTTQC